MTFLFYLSYLFSHFVFICMFKWAEEVTLTTKCNDHKQENQNQTHKGNPTGFLLISDEYCGPWSTCREIRCYLNRPPHRCLLAVSAVGAHPLLDTMALITSQMLCNRSSHEKWLPVCILGTRAQKTRVCLQCRGPHIKTAQLLRGHLNFLLSN